MFTGFAFFDKKIVFLNVFKLNVFRTVSKSFPVKPRFSNCFLSFCMPFINFDLPSATTTGGLRCLIVEPSDGIYNPKSSDYISIFPSWIQVLCFFKKRSF